MAQQNIATLKSNINTQINDNTAGEISAADVRNNLINMTDSLLFNSGSQGITGSLDLAENLTVNGNTSLGNHLTDTTVISGSLTIMSNGVANSTAQALIIKNAIDSQDTGSIDITSTNNTQIPSIVLRNSDNTAILKITEYGTDNAQIDLSGGGTNNLFISAGGKLDFYAATIVISSTLPTAEPAVSGQLWLSGSAGINSKILCVRN